MTTLHRHHCNALNTRFASLSRLRYANQESISPVIARSAATRQSGLAQRTQYQQQRSHPTCHCEEAPPTRQSLVRIDSSHDIHNQELLT